MSSGVRQFLTFATAFMYVELEGLIRSIIEEYKSVNHSPAALNEGDNQCTLIHSSLTADSILHVNLYIL